MKTSLKIGRHRKKNSLFDARITAYNRDFSRCSSWGRSIKLNRKYLFFFAQITLLLQNQDELNVQIKQLANTDKKPTACHEMCDHILRRVQELERVVQQNAEELAQMKSHLQNAHDSS